MPIPLNEEWRVIPSFPCYAASSEGRIRRCDSAPMSRCGDALAVKLDLDGYETVRVYIANNKRHRLRIHRAVAEAFIGPKPPDKEVNHKDTNKRNNRPGNLEYVTKLENIRHATEHGLRALGERNWTVKIKTKDVIEIRQLAADGYPQTYIAEKFGLSTSGVFGIVHRITWRHV